MDLSDKCPITKQIDNMDETIKELNSRIGKFNSQLPRNSQSTTFKLLANLEGKLKLLMPDSVERKTLTLELTEIKKLVATHENRLKELRKNNRKSFLLCAIIIFLIFLIYCTYVMLYGYWKTAMTMTVIYEK